MRIILKIVRAFYVITMALLLALSLVFALLQTKWAKEKIAQFLATAGAHYGWDVKIGHVEGRLPFTWRIDQLLVQAPSGAALELENVDMRIAIFPLLNKTLSFNYFHVDSAHLTLPQGQNLSLSSTEEIKSSLKILGVNLSIPYRILLHRLRIDALYLPKTHGAYRVIASGDLDKKLRRFQGHIRLNLRGHPDNFCIANVEGNLQKDKASFDLQVHLEDTLGIRFSLSGPWKSWSALLNEQQFPTPLVGECQAHAEWKLYQNDLKNQEFGKEVSQNSSLEQATIVQTQDASDEKNFEKGPPQPKTDSLDHFAINTHFLIPSYHALSFSKCELRTPLFEAHITGDVEENLKKSSLRASFSLPDLSALSKGHSLDLKGSAQGKASYTRGHFQGTIFSDALSLHSLPLQHLSAHCHGYFDGEKWEGSAACKTQAENLPLNADAEFIWLPRRELYFKNFSLDGPGLMASGDLHIDIPFFVRSGHLSAHATHLNRLVFLFPEGTVDGAVELDCELWTENQVQTTRCSLAGKNLLFNEYSVEEIALNTTLSDLFHKPLGQWHLFAKEFRTPLGEISALRFDTASNDEEEWAFFLQSEGIVQEPFFLVAQGGWEKEGALFNVEFAKFSGKISSEAFFLKYPFTFEKGSQFAFLSPLNMHVGEGDVLATFHLAPQRSTAQVSMQHFPLKILSIFYPQQKFTGRLSSQGFLDATPDNLQGAFHADLEEWNFISSEKKEPLKVKGSLQAHLDHGILQTHAYLNASREQFLDFSATLPVRYALYPFAFSLNMHKPVASEFIAEGRLQDLFAFINLGNHRITGQLSARLFLSQSLNSPALQGDIEWTDGSYENFLTGTVLKEIDARLQAQKEKIQLLSFEAKDDKKGTATAEGTIHLEPRADFPYAFVAELNNVHAVRFNLIDCHLTGPMYIKGTLKEALVQGNFLVPHAHFKIPDKMPFEVPLLPVSYVNWPHFSSQTWASPARFPFHIQWELTADERAFVTGKGLDSEWRGSLLLNGTNMNVLANGTLHLVKGEYALFGKIFKLTEGQIAFNDKPSTSATLNLSGTLSLADTTITAHLRGPLSSPTLTLQSNPQMSTSAILARILFNKDIADISQPEAIQLATALISLSSDAGPSILETIRKNIGVDRLTIASQTANPDEIAVQIGKYVTKGVLITLSQSATSSQVIVEVEFRHGFVFQAETQKEEEGKFSLKWTHSY